MAAKLLHSLTDENPDLQIGCMTGIFQLFDRQQMISGRRISPKRLPPGSSHINNGTSEADSYSIYRQPTAKEKNSNKNVNEKQRVSTESSRPSFSSSSRSSSFSSLDCNRTAQPEPLSFDRIIFPETPSRDPSVNQSGASPQFRRLSLDIRDVVKDSMQREARGVAAKSTTKDETADRVVKDKDSPRPLQVPKSVDGTYTNVGINGKKNLPADLKDSIKVLAKLREAPWYDKEYSRSLHESKDGYFFSNPKDAPRFSCDGREITHLSFESRDTFNKSSPKLKELPRLSLDSRECSMRNLDSDSKSNFLFRNSQKDSLQQTSETQARPPGLVAKLMGLDALPNSALASDSKMGLIKTCLVEDCEPPSQLSKSTEPCRPIRVFNPSKNSWKEPTSPRWKSTDPAMKPISRFPIEPAPWKQIDASRVSQKPAFKHVKGHIPRSTDSFPSVYSEIEKRLNDLEFTQSGKDLRALKQILEAMQAKGLLDSKKEEIDLNFETRQDHEIKRASPNQRKPWSRESNSSRTFESPIVIMKPAKLVEKSSIPSSSIIPIDGLAGLPRIRNGDFVDNRKGSVNSRAVKDQIPKTTGSSDKRTSSRNLKPVQNLTRPQELPKENTTSTVKSSGSVSPRLQQKKLELEKRSRPPTPPSDSSKARRQSNKPQPESSSPGGKRRPKPSDSQRSNNDQSSEFSGETRKSSYQEDDLHLQSEGIIVIDSKIDIEVTSSDQSSEINGSQSPSLKAAHYSFSRSSQKKSTVKLSEDDPLAEMASVAPEHPSPVSVLDDSVYRDDAPSLVKQIPSNFKDDEARNPHDDSSKEQWDPTDNLSSNAMVSGLTSDISRKKLQNIENLVQKLRRLNSNHDEDRTDYIASLCENANPDDRYISEILLASGLLLRDLGSSLSTFQLHPSGHPINPELFLVLEQTKFSAEKTVNAKSDKEKFHRKLIFDAVNEILVGKLDLVGPASEPWLKPKKVARKTFNAQKLLRELCSEIEQIQARKPECSLLENEDDGLKSILWEDVMSESECWYNFQGEISVVVLDIERLIFKDLVSEIVTGEAAGARGKLTGKRCRRLFAK